MPPSDATSHELPASPREFLGGGRVGAGAVGAVLGPLALGALVARHSSHTIRVATVPSTTTTAAAAPARQVFARTSSGLSVRYLVSAQPSFPGACGPVFARRLE